jgi:uncharacterized coiled-coil protein SlyX
MQISRLPGRSLLLLLAAMLLSAACSSAKPETGSAPRTPTRRAVRETVTVRDADLERRLARLELRVIEKETQVEELQSRLDDTRDEVVRTMAKLQTLASRAEAASAMAETDVALQALRSSTGAQQIPETGQASRLMQQSTQEFDKQNFGGALYLANQAKASAAAGRARLAGGNRAGTSRPGETPFALPIRVKVDSRGNVREGPSTNFAVAFAVDAGTNLTGYSYSDEWVRISDDSGRSGWIIRTLLTRP